MGWGAQAFKQKHILPGKKIDSFLGKKKKLFKGLGSKTNLCPRTKLVFLKTIFFKENQKIFSAATIDTERYFCLLRFTEFCGLSRSLLYLKDSRTSVSNLINFKKDYIYIHQHPTQDFRISLIN